MLHWTNFVIYTKENYIYGNVEQEIEVKNSWVPHYLLQTQYFPKCIVVFPSSIKELCYFFVTDLHMCVLLSKQHKPKQIRQTKSQDKTKPTNPNKIKEKKTKKNFGNWKLPKENCTSVVLCIPQEPNTAR